MKLVVREMIMIIISKDCFSQFFFNGFVFLAELDKPNEIERSLWLVISILFVLARGHYLMQKKEVGCMV